MEVSGERVLVPMVYLSQATADRLNNDGALIAGDNVAIEASGAARNDGTISGSHRTAISADTLINTGALNGGSRLAIVVVGVGASASGSYSQSKVDSHYASVTTVSGIGAGDMRAWTVAVAGAVLLMGCVNPQAFQPPPTDEELWHKAGATSSEITKALLECGDVSPRRSRFNNEPKMTPNEIVLMDLCMAASGFTSNFDDSADGYCKRWPGPKPSACAPGTPAPARDVAKRLNSAFCHAYPKADVCTP
jgi:hypothetical protein